MKAYNLLDEPWIPVINNNNIHQKIGLRTLLLEAHNLKEVYHDSPLIVLAVYRLLLAFAHRLVTISSPPEWQKMYDKNSFSEKDIEEYCEKWHHRFFLFDDRFPFYQVADHPAGESSNSINKIVLDRSAGNTPVYFDHSSDDHPVPLSPGDAALNLLAFNAFTPGGGINKSGINYKHSPLTSALISLLTGDSIYQTLLLNYIINNPNFNNAGIPCWEKDRSPVPESLTTIEGYIDYLTLQSRITQLVPDISDSGILITKIKIVQGRGLPEELFEPFAAYYLTKEGGFNKVRISPAKHVWRDFNTLLSLTDLTVSIPPQNIQQLAVLKDLGFIDKNSKYSLFCGGISNDQAKILLWTASVLPLPAELINNEQLVSLISRMLSFAESKAKSLYYFTRHISKNLLSFNDKSEDKKAVAALTNTLSAEDIYWSELEVPFKQIILNIAVSSDDPESFELDWQDTCKNAEKRCKKIIEQSLSFAPRGPFAIAKAYSSNSGELL